MSFQPGANIYTQGFGSRPENVEVPHIDVRAPSSTDIMYPVGKIWINQNTSSYQLLGFTVSNGVTSANWQAFGSTIQAGNNINITTSKNTVTVNLNNQVLQPDGTTGAPSYSFTNHPDSGMWENGPNVSFSWQGNEFIGLQGGGIELLGSVIYDSAINLTYVAPSSWPYVATGNDVFISVNTSSARTVQLPNAPRTGRMFVIKDRTGSAAANNITVTTVGGAVNIDGSTSYTINTNYGHIQLLFNGTSYEVF